MYNTESAAAIGIGLAIFLIFFYIVILAVAIVCYIVFSKAMFNISKRRNIPNPWMAWVPMLNYWNLGCVANHCDEQQGKKSRWNLILTVVYGCYFVVYTVYMCVYAVITVLSAAGSEVTLVLSFVSLFFALIMMVGSVASTVIYAICMYKIYNSIVPEKAVLYLVLSLVVPVACAICMAKAANADCYMPQEVISDEIE